jgi:Ser/Thr protein kinase RdoA (MazF antagonist)
VLQRINGAVFPAPARIMDNLAALQAVAAAHPALGVRLPALAAADDDLPYTRDGDGEYWRLMECIEPSRTLKRLDTALQAAEVGRVLGRFHRLGALLEPDALAVTLPGFHHTPGYLASLDSALGETRLDADAAATVAGIDARRALVGVLDDALAHGLTRRRVIHGDPKVDNLLFDADGERALCLIDLDTVQPGLVHHDIGDCLRSCCNRGGEAGASSVHFDLALCEALLRGYADAAGRLLNAAELDLLAPAIRLIPLELAIRFLTDHLQGDRYFRVRQRGENLTKARRQLALVADIERQAAAIDAAVRSAFAAAG